MALLDRVRRRPNGPDSSTDPADMPEAAEADTTVDDPAVVDSADPAPTDDVIRGLAAWTQLPPLRPVTPTMPLFVGFADGAVASITPPQQFLADLGHLVSYEAPAGLVEGVAVLHPPESVAPDDSPEAPAQSDLPLAPPAPSRAETPVASPGAVLRLPDRLLPVARPLPATDQAVAAEPAPSRAVTVLVEQPGESAPIEALVPLVQPQAFTPEPVTGPDLPLVPLPSLPIPDELKAAAAPEATEVAGLVGAEATGVSPVLGPVAVAETSAEPGVTRTGDEVGTADLPLAAPPGSPAPQATTTTVFSLDPETGLALPGSSSDPTDRELSTPGPATTTPAGPADPPPPAAPVERADTSDPAPADPIGPGDIAPLVGGSEPPRAFDHSGEDGVAVLAVTGQPTTGSGPTEDLSAPVDAGLTDLPLATPPEAAGPGTGTPEIQASPPMAGGDPLQAPVVVPLVGSDERMAVRPPEATGEGSEPEPTAGEPPVGSVSTPPSRARSGLGAPMTGLPATARSYDLSRLSMTERHVMSRAMMEVELRKGSAPPIPVIDVAGARRPSAGALPLIGRDRSGAAHNPVSSWSGPPAVEGLLPDDLPVTVEGQAPLVAFRDMGEATEPREETNDDEGSEGRAAVGRLYGLDLDVPIDRTPRTALEAHHAGARAFTTQSGIFIPADAGSLDSGPGQALLVHELTHAAQRQRSGGFVPAEETPEGQALEAEALFNEQAFATTRTLPSLPFEPDRQPGPTGGSLPVIRPLFQATDSGSMAVAQSTVGTPGGVSAGMPLAVSAGPDVDAIATSVFAKVSEQITEAPASPSSFTSEPVPAAAGMQRAVEAPPVPESTTTAPTSADQTMERPNDDDLDRLSGWLYPLIRFRLRRELREDRERAGLLTDHYRRW